MQINKSSRNKYLTHKFYHEPETTKFNQFIYYSVKNCISSSQRQCKVQPRYASLGYPFRNMAAHM